MGYTRGDQVGWREVFEKLRQRIEAGQFAPGQQLPTEAKLIEELGASKMTVHRALRELAATGLVHRIERVGTFVSESAPMAARQKVGLFLPTTDGFLEIKYLSGIREVLGEDQQILLYATDNESVLEMELLDKAITEVDGILILTTGHPRVARKLEEINENVCPVVCIDREPPNTNLPSVTTDNYAVTRAGIESLLANGHRRIAYFGLYAPEMSSNADRMRAFQDAMAASGIEDPAYYMRFIEARDSAAVSVELRLFEDALFRLTAGPEPITAAFCANEHYLSVLLEVVQALPPQTLEGFEIVSFCDWPMLSFSTVRTHLIRQDAKAIGRSAAELLKRAIAGETIPADRLEINASFEPASGSLTPGLARESQ